MQCEPECQIKLTCPVVFEFATSRLVDKKKWLENGPIAIEMLKN